MQWYVSFLLTAALTLPCDSVAARSGQRQPNPQLGNELKQLRSQLRAELVQPRTGLSEVSSVQSQSIATPKAVPGELKKLQEQVQTGLAEQQHLTEQLHTSEASSAWLIGELHDETGKLQEEKRQQDAAEQRALEADARAKAAEEDNAHQLSEVEKFKEREKTVKKMVKKMLHADQDLEKRTNGLQKEVNKLREGNRKLLDTNGALAKAKASAEEATTAANGTIAQLQAKVQSDETEMEALQHFFTEKEAAFKKQDEELKNEKQVELNLRDTMVRKLQQQIQNATKKVTSINAAEEDAVDREKDEENKEAASEVSIKDLRADEKHLEAQTAELSAQNDGLRQRNSLLQGKLNNTMERVNAQQQEVRRTQEDTCSSVERKLSQVQNTKKKMHQALNDAVRLARKMQHENKLLERALGDAKSRMQSIMHSDGEASSGLQKQIRQLHHQLQEKDAALIRIKEMRNQAIPSDDGATLTQADEDDQAEHGAAPSQADDDEQAAPAPEDADQQADVVTDEVAEPPAGDADIGA